MANKLLKIAEQITSSYDSSSSIAYSVFEQYLEDFYQELNRTAKPSLVIDVIKHNENNMLIPFDLIKKMYSKLLDLGERTPFVLRWYASMLASYSDEFNNPEVGLLLAEADKLEKQE